MAKLMLVVDSGHEQYWLGGSSLKVGRGALATVTSTQQRCPWGSGRVDPHQRLGGTSRPGMRRQLWTRGAGFGAPC